MRKRLLEILVCPSCKSKLALKEGVYVNEKIKSGILACQKCTVSYKIENYIPRFVDSDTYVNNFSLEWTLHAKTQIDNNYSKKSLNTFKQKTGLSENDIKDKLVLDAGCGSGRFSDIALRWGGEVIGVDLSYSVESAQKNFSHYNKFDVVQADIFHLPFSGETFDIIYSIGVLHHTINCKNAFKQLPPLLKRGGKIAVWVYSSHLYRGIDARIMEAYRKIGCKLPRNLLYAICRLISLSYPLWNNRLMSRIWHLVLPGIIFHAVPMLANYKKYDWRLLDNFDFYSPRFQSKHSYPEVYSWFIEENLKNIELLDFEVALKGEKLTLTANTSRKEQNTLLI